MSITQWPPTERPRERLLSQGAAALSDAELLAIFLRVGTPGKSAVDLARELIHQLGSLNGLFTAGADELCAIKGIGLAKYVQLQAVREMAKRALSEEMRLGDTLNSPVAVRNYLRLSMANLPHETFMAVFLTTQNRVIAVEELFRGSLCETRVYPREAVKRALAHNAAAIIFAHNHPSGDAAPSPADHTATQTLIAALALIDCFVLDHLIITPTQIYSFAEQGNL